MSNIASAVEAIPNTFTSWDKCMSKAYCKWPVIAGIIIGSLIVLSIVWCLARCLCCGASCCCSCLRCLDCFTPNRHGRDRQSRFKDDYRPANQGFQPMPSPMIYQPNAPQFATFDAPSGRINEDSLPPMPSWETAQKRRVEEPSEDDATQGHGEDLEMGSMAQHPQKPSTRGPYSQLPLGPKYPVQPSYGYHQSSEYYGAGGSPPPGADPYNSDLSAQHLLGSQQVPPRHQSYSSSQPSHNTPLSPAPTYRTNLPETDRFTPAAVSPSPEQYNRTYTHSPALQQPLAQQYSGRSQAYAPSTMYEPTEPNSQPHYVTVTQQHAPAAYGYSDTGPGGQQRPPNLLARGRKPVNGSLREI